jgi:hypothetical protein
MGLQIGLQLGEISIERDLIRIDTTEADPVVDLIPKRVIRRAAPR